MLRSLSNQITILTFVNFARTVYRLTWIRTTVTRLVEIWFNSFSLHIIIRTVPTFSFYDKEKSVGFYLLFQGHI